MTLKKCAILTFVASSLQAQAMGADNLEQELGTPNDRSLTQSPCSERAMPVFGSADCLDVDVDKVGGWRENLPPLFLSLRIEIPPYFSPMDSSPVHFHLPQEFPVVEAFVGASLKKAGSGSSIVPDVDAFPFFTSPNVPVLGSSALFPDLGSPFETVDTQGYTRGPKATNAGVEVI